MKIKIANGVQTIQNLSEVVDLSNYDFSANYSLKGIKPFHLNVTFETFEEVVEVHLTADIPLVLECAYTLEHFEDVILFDEELTFNFKNPTVEVESDDVFYEKGPVINLDPYVFALILTYIPLKVIKPGAKLPASGEGYQVFSEEEFINQKTHQESPFDELLDRLEPDED